MRKQIRKGDRVMLIAGPARGIRGTVVKDGDDLKAVRWDAAIITVPDGFESIHEAKHLAHLIETEDELKEL